MARRYRRKHHKNNKHLFSQIPSAFIQRSVFDRSHDVKTTFSSGYLVPFYVDEALPGDTFTASTTAFVRMATPVVPVMDNLHLDFFYFAVPLRLVWDNFQKFMGEREDPEDSIDYLCPVVEITQDDATNSSIWDYFGLPTVDDVAVAQGHDSTDDVDDYTMEVDAFWPRAYNLIYNEWFRDENLIDSVDVPTDDGPDEASTYTLLRRGKRHDYFTSALPWPQKGDSVTVDLIGDATVSASFSGDQSTGTIPILWSNGITNNLVFSSPETTVGNTASRLSTGILGSNTTLGTYDVDDNDDGEVTANILPIPGLYQTNMLHTTQGDGDSDLVDTSALSSGWIEKDNWVTWDSQSTSVSGSTIPDLQDLYESVSDTQRALGITPNSLVNALNQLTLSSSSGGQYITINDLRQAFQVQKLLERDARGGTRYTEILRSHFGVISPDARLQRPEYLGGGSVPITVVPVAQTSASTDSSAQGNLAAFGYAVSRSGGFSKSFVEHSVIIGLMEVRADLTYQQGINRMWSRQTRYDFYWPVLSHLGEQSVLNKEIFYSSDSDQDDSVFGYQERWAEYRYFPSQITGQFRSSFPESLDIWHFSQFFEELPTLGQTFIEDDPPVERVLAVTDEEYPQFLADIHMKLRCARPMPVYSVPGLVDHF